jgi:hyperosmotically inducible periplasmic protein
MKTKLVLATVLATAMNAGFAAVPTAALNHDPATYRNVTQKTAADFKAATAKCASMSGNAKGVCIEEAKAARAHAEADAVAQYNNTPKGRAKARTAVADADFSLAKAKCADMSGAEKDACINNATAVHTAAVADARADRDTVVAATDTTSPVTTTATRDATKAAAVEKCAQVAGQPNTGCLIDNKRDAATATTTTTTTGTVTNRSEATAATAGQKTGEAMDTAAEKTRNAAAIAADKTRDAAATVAEKTRNVAATAADKTRDATAAAAARTGPVLADSVITTKVKADIFKEPELKSMGIHVETEKGVVMLSGFVDSKADADKAVKLARSVEGVTSVKSAIKVK